MWDLLILNVFLIYIAAENSNCDDSDSGFRGSNTPLASTVNERIKGIWLNTKVYYSYEACDASSQDDGKF